MPIMQMYEGIDMEMQMDAPRAFCWPRSIATAAKRAEAAA